MKLVGLVTLSLGLMSSLGSSSPPNHQILNLDNLKNEQLAGVLNGEWKDQLIGELKEKVAKFSLPSHQLEENISRRHFSAMQQKHQTLRHQLHSTPL